MQASTPAGVGQAGLPRLKQDGLAPTLPPIVPAAVIGSRGIQMKSQRATLLLSAALATVLFSSCSRTDIPARLMDIHRWEDARQIPGDSLYVLLESGPYRVRKAAALALGRIGRREAVSPLEERLLRDRRPEVRREAAFALGLIPTSSSAVALLAGAEKELNSTSGGGRRGSPEVLGEIILALGRVGQPGTAEEIVRALRHPHPLVREQTLEALALLADSTVVDAIIQASHDPVESVTWRAAYALEKVPSQSAALRLVELMGHSDPVVRAFAARALGRMGSPEGDVGIEALRQRLHETEWTVRVNAARSLGRLSARDCENDLLQVLSDENFQVRAAGLEALAALAPLSNWQPVSAACSDSSTVVRHAAYSALAATLGERSAPQLREGLDDPSSFVQGHCLELWGSVHAEGALAALRSVLQSDQTRLRPFAVEGLAGLASPEALALLRGILDDDDWVVVSLAAADLGRLGDHAAIDPLVKVYEKWNRRNNADVLEAILVSLGKLRATGQRKILEEALAGNDRRLRVAARDALELVLSETEATRLPTKREILLDTKPVQRSPEQPPLVAASNARELILDTSRGRIVIDLYYDIAPQTCESFARLADAGFFNGLDFHRVVPNFVIQGGDPLGSGWGDAGYVLRSEWSPLRFDRGTVGVATNGKDTGSCQLFITHSPQPRLDARYTLFGRVVEGMEVVDSIQVEDTFTAKAVWSEQH